jgi:hypothetical protein
MDKDLTSLFSYESHTPVLYQNLILSENIYSLSDVSEDPITFFDFLCREVPVLFSVQNSLSRSTDYDMS